MIAIVRLGLLSDSHGRAETTRRAVSLLVRAEADALIFLGDAGSVEVLDALVAGQVRARGPRPPVHVVWGNADEGAERLESRCRELGIADHGGLGRIEAAGRRAVFLHGHQKRLLESALAEGPDYLFHGHTHVPRDERSGRTRVINPGALFRARRYTVALVDLLKDRVDFLEVSR